MQGNSLVFSLIDVESTTSETATVCVDTGETGTTLPASVAVCGTEEREVWAS